MMYVLVLFPTVCTRVRMFFRKCLDFTDSEFCAGVHSVFFAVKLTELCMMHV